MDPRLHEVVSEPNELRLGMALSELGRLTTRPTVRADGPTHGRLEQLCEALTIAAEIRVVPHVVSSYGDLLAGLHWGEIQLAWLPPMVALRAITRGGAVPMVAPIRAGSAWYWTSLFVRSDSRVQDLAELAGARAAWVDHYSAAGYLVIRASLRKQGLDFSKAFSEERFHGTHDAVARAVAEGGADVGATYSHFDDAGRIRNAGWGRTSVRVLKSAGPIPSDVLAASSLLAPATMQLLTDTLTASGHADVQRTARDLFGSTGFCAVDRNHLGHLEELLGYLEAPESQR
jgi:phosphonate transport system substrate-binding protein